MPTQNQTISMIKTVIKIYFPDARFIKIAGSKFQESGLPDMMCLPKSKFNHHLWFEVKANWQDTPTDLQRWNIETSLRLRGMITFYAVGRAIKFNWTDKKAIPAAKLMQYLSKNGNFSKDKFLTFI